MKFAVIILAAISLMGCSGQKDSVGYIPTLESIEREKLSDEIIAKVATKLQQEKKLIPIGFGGCTSNGIKMLALSFHYRQPINIEKSRELLIASVQEFVLAVSEDKRIHKYLYTYPFEPKNVEISIFLHNPDDSPVTSGLHVISAIDGKLRYKIDDPNGPLFKTVLEETYEEALEKLKTQNQKAQAESLERIAI